MPVSPSTGCTHMGPMNVFKAINTSPGCDRVTLTFTYSGVHGTFYCEGPEGRIGPGANYQGKPVVLCHVDPYFSRTLWVAPADRNPNYRIEVTA
jgi:hypothetical protein